MFPEDVAAAVSMATCLPSHVRAPELVILVSQREFMQQFKPLLTNPVVGCEILMSRRICNRRFSLVQKPLTSQLAYFDRAFCEFYHGLIEKRPTQDPKTQAIFTPITWLDDLIRE